MVNQKCLGILHCFRIGRAFGAIANELFELFRLRNAHDTVGRLLGTEFCELAMGCLDVIGMVNQKHLGNCDELRVSKCAMKLKTCHAEMNSQGSVREDVARS